MFLCQWHENNGAMITMPCSEQIMITFRNGWVQSLNIKSACFFPTLKAQSLHWDLLGHVNSEQLRTISYSSFGTSHLWTYQHINILIINHTMKTSEHYLVLIIPLGIAMLELPDDDEGDWTCEPSPVSKPPCKRPKLPEMCAAPRPVGQKPASQVALPDDDDVGFDLSMGGVSDGSGGSGGSGDNSGLKTWDDSTLITATNSIPSVVHCPYHDLLDYLKHPAPSCDAELRCHLWELFSAPRVTPAVRALNGRARRSFDLKHFWDLGETAFQRTVLQDILLLRPLCVMLSPPCTMVCQLQHSNWRRMKYKDRFVCLREALGLIDFSAWVAMVLLCLGLFFAMEHPEGSLAWTRDSVPLSWMLKNWFALATSTSIHTYQVKPSCNQTN